MNYFAKNIKFLLSNSKMSRDELATLVGKKRSVIGSYIRGEAIPNINILSHIANYFGIDLNTLITIDIENELNNLGLNDVKLLANLLYNRKHEIKANKTIRILDKNQLLTRKHVELKNRMDILENEQQELFNKNKIITKQLNELYKINKTKRSENIGTNIFRNYNQKNFVLLCVFIGFLFILYFGIKHINNMNNFSGNDIFNKYYRPYKEDIYKGSEFNISNIKENYAYGDYFKILENFNEISVKDSIYIDVCFYKGLACIELNQIKSAIDNFTKIVLNANNKYTHEARWYLALSYLKVDQIERAKDYFEDIIKIQRYKSKESKEILKLIK